MICRKLPVMVAGIVLILSGTTFGNEHVVTIETRQGVRQSFILIEPKDAPKIAVVMLPGGGGVLDIKKDANGVTFNQHGFMQRARNHFVDSGMAVAIADAPSDQRELWREFRMTASHARDIEGVIDYLKARYGPIPVYLMGISRGGLSVVYLARQLAERVTGIVPMSPLFRDAKGASLEFFDWGRLKQRILIVGHRNDGCRNTPFSESAYVAKEYRLPLLAASGGYEDLTKSRSGSCGPWAHHNFLGIEKPVADEIINWIFDRPYKSEVSE